MDDAIREALEQAGRCGDDDIPLADTALALAAVGRPRVPLDRYRAHLDRLGAEVGDVVGEAEDADAQSAAAALRAVMAERYGYRGDDDTYDDLQNASLIRVIDRRKGLPVALGILYIHVARAQGWQMVGLNFPGHFMVRLEVGAGRVILDPFHAGIVRPAAQLRDLLKTVSGDKAELKPEHYAPVSDREILLRLQNNIKLRHLRQQRLDDALEVIEAMLLIAPEEPWLWRECGILSAKNGNRVAAIAALERFRTDGAAHGLPENLLHEAAILLQQLKLGLN